MLSELKNKHLAEILKFASARIDASDYSPSKPFIVHLLQEYMSDTYDSGYTEGYAQGHAQGSLRGYVQATSRQTISLDDQ